MSGSTTSFYRGENPLRADKLNTAFGERVLRSGDTMQGMLTLWRDPVGPFDAATKQYIDRNSIPPIAVSDTPPNSPPTGMLWFDGVGQQLYVRYADPNSTQWVPATNVAALGMAGGPFLPLSGGNVTGPTDFAATIQGTTFETYNHRIQTGGTLNTALGIYGDLSGTKTGGNFCFARINLINDTLAAGGAGLATLLVDQNSGGVGTTGNRIGLSINFNFTGGTTNKGLGIGSQYGGLWAYSTASGNVGGTSGAGGWGELWGGICSANLASGATFWNYCVGLEVDFGVSTGANANYSQGIKIVLAHHNQTVNLATDYMLGMAKYALTDVGLGNGIVFGSPDGYWPIDSTGTLIGTLASNLATPPARAAANGVDLSAVTFSGSAFKSTGFNVSGAGDGLLTTLNVSSPSGNDPLTVTTTAANYARVRYVGSRQWTAGVFPDGSYNLTDETGAAVRLTVTPTGTTTLSGHTAFGAGIDFGTQSASSATDLSKHINLAAGAIGINWQSAGNVVNLNTGGSGVFAFNVAGTPAVYIGAANLNSQVTVMAPVIQTGGSSGPTWTTGSAAPASTQPVGSLYSRVGGAVGATLYVSRGAGTWAAVAGV